MPLLSSGQGVLMQEAFIKGDVQGVKDAWSKLGNTLAEKAEKMSSTSGVTQEAWDKMSKKDFLKSLTNATGYSLDD